MIVHHTGIASEKENRARGNPALKGAMQVEMMVLRNPDTGQVMLKQTKQKDLEPMPDMFFTLKKVVFLQLMKMENLVRALFLSVTKRKGNLLTTSLSERTSCCIR